MPDQPNVLMLILDGTQGRVVNPGHPCLTPNFDRIIERGVRMTNAHTCTSVCSPARAGLMTGLLVSDDPPTGTTRFSQWLDDNAKNLGLRYANELGRHYHEPPHTSPGRRRGTSPASSRVRA